MKVDIVDVRTSEFMNLPFTLLNGETWCITNTILRDLSIFLAAVAFYPR